MHFVTRMVAFGAGLVVGAGGLYLCLRAEHRFPQVTASAQAAEAPMIPAPPVKAADDDFHRLMLHDLASPISGMKPETLEDSFASPRPGKKTHEAIDIPAPRGTPVHALDDGVISGLYVSAKGGITIYQTDRDSVYCYYYAHLARYANRLHEGMTVKHGDIIGYVGTSGDAPANGPHLHLAITRLGATGQWMEGAPVNPYPLLTALSGDFLEDSN